MEARTAPAYHEAGHAVAAWDQRIRIFDATIIPSDRSLGSVTWQNVLAGLNLDIAEGAELKRGLKLAKRIVIGIKAGPAAERRADPLSFDGAGADADHREMVFYAYNALGDEDGNDWLLARDADVERVLNRHWPAVEALASALLEQGTIGGSEVEQIISASTRYRPSVRAPREGALAPLAP